MKVLHCPTDTGGHAWGLSRAERMHGVASDVMVRRSSWLQYPCDVDLRLREGMVLSRVHRMIRFLARAARHYDVFHFNWGMSVLDHRSWNVHYLELPLLKRLNKRLIMTFQGCDARFKGESQRTFPISACAECTVPWCTPRMDKVRQRRIMKAAAYVDQMFALNPDLLHFLPHAEFLPYASIDPGDWQGGGTIHQPQSSRRPVCILHMPTNRSIKGTAYVEQACGDLQAEGWSLELILVEGRPHREIKDLVARADLVVDQLLVGWYGTMAVEAMASGKPVLCYLREQDLERFVPRYERIPLVRTTKHTLTQDLRRLLQNPLSWEPLGAAGQAYVRDVHHPMKVAERTIAAYQHQ